MSCKKITQPPSKLNHQHFKLGTYPIGERVLPPLVQDDKKVGKGDGLDPLILKYNEFVQRDTINCAGGFVDTCKLFGPECGDFVVLGVVSEDPECVLQVLVLYLAVARHVEEVKRLEKIGKMLKHCKHFVAV